MRTTNSKNKSERIIDCLQSTKSIVTKSQSNKSRKNFTFINETRIEKKID